MLNKKIYLKGMKALDLISSKKLDVEIFWEFLKNLNDNDFKQAIFHIIDTEKTIVAGTNIVYLIKNAIIKSSTKYKSPEEAWGEVYNKVGEIGYQENFSHESSNELKFSNEIIKKTVDLVGWKRICLSEEGVKNIEWSFKQTYTSLLNSNNISQQNIFLDDKVINEKLPLT